MAAKWHKVGKRYLLECAISEVQTAPANFYVGLCTDSDPAADATLGDLTELASSGYARQAIPSSAAGFTSSDPGGDDWKLEATAENFANSSGFPWTAANSWFLATTVDDTGVLLASGPLDGAPLTIADGSDHDITITLRSVDG